MSQTSSRSKAPEADSTTKYDKSNGSDLARGTILEFHEDGIMRTFEHPYYVEQVIKIIISNILITLHRAYRIILPAQSKGEYNMSIMNSLL